MSFPLNPYRVEVAIRGGRPGRPIVHYVRTADGSHANETFCGYSDESEWLVVRLTADQVAVIPEVCQCMGCRREGAFS